MYYSEGLISTIPILNFTQTHARARARAHTHTSLFKNVEIARKNL